MKKEALKLAMKESTDCKCEKIKREKVTQVIRIAKQDVLIENAPARVCQDCGEIYLEGRFILNLEGKLLSEQQPLDTLQPKTESL